MKFRKKFLYYIIVFLLIVGICFFIVNMIKKNNIGNNIGSQEIVDRILNIKSYKAKSEVQVSSNKNENKYILNQEYNNNESIQEVIEPSNIAGTKIIKKGEKLTIENTKLNLNNVFENYKGLEENALDLNIFIKEYKNDNSSFFEEEENEIVLKTKNKRLYINKNNKLPNKLIVYGDNQKNKIVIIYKEIEIN